jgi:hypothetical protein
MLCRTLNANRRLLGVLLRLNFFISVLNTASMEYLKGQCHEIICFSFFFMNHLPLSP